jgi:glutamyl-tRNA synthetase
MEAHAPIASNQPERGVRVLAFTGSVLLPRSEIETGRMLRLKDLFNIRITGEGSAEYAGNSLAEARAAKAPIVQWLPAGACIPCSLLTPEGTSEGYCEAAVQKYDQKIVQFERVGFARIDAVKDGQVTAYFTHR